jgi:hypothetical protein
VNIGLTEALTERVAAALGPLDRARGLLLSIAAGVARPLLRDRGLRIVTLSTLSIVVAFSCAWLAPMMLLAIGPVVLGVPHLLSDVRYLVARPGFHKRPAFWVLVVGPLGLVYSRPEVWVGLVAAMGAVLIARTTLLRRALALAGLGCLAYFVHGYRGVAEIWMAHAHNLIALGMWTMFFRARTRRTGDGKPQRGVPLAPTVMSARAALLRKHRHLFVALLFAAGAALLFTLPIGNVAPFAGLDLETQSRSLSPFRDPELSLRFVLFFAFAQSVHYAIWLRAVPDEARPREGIRSFASTARALSADVSPWLLAAFMLLTVGIVGWALHDLIAARTGYLRLAISHGYLELAVATLFLLERATPTSTPTTT